VFCLEKSGTSGTLWIQAFAGMTKLPVLLRLFPSQQGFFSILPAFSSQNEFFKKYLTGGTAII
jgi:hypothetical protein